MAKRKREPVWHVLDFYCDHESSCALTAYVSRVRAHVIADAKQLDRASKLGAEYWDLVDKFRAQSGDNTTERKKSNDSGSKDSGVDVSADGAGSSPQDDRAEDDDAESTLQSWMLAPLFTGDGINGNPKTSTQQETLQRWYHNRTRFYQLAMSEKGDCIEAIELESTTELEQEIDNLLPSVTLPKSLMSKINAPCFQASELNVLRCSDQPPGTPYHPCRVRHRKTKRTYFLKVVDNGQPRTTKRELDVLGHITNLELNKKMNVPTLEALVCFDDASASSSGRRKIMGFLQTEIPDPTPLTNLLDTSIPQAKRERWAREAERLKTILHENNIIWGDAKADNFMVDVDDKLWIIDFGGSYTEGWIDPELNETEEGDDMGTLKTVNALKDPEANTYQPGETEDSAKDAKQQDDKQRRKRKADKSADTITENESSKRRRSARLKQ